MCSEEGNLMCLEVGSLMFILGMQSQVSAFLQDMGIGSLNLLYILSREFENQIQVLWLGKLLNKCR